MRCLRNHPAGQKWLARWEKTQGQGNALTILAPKRARAVYDLLRRKTAVALDIFVRAERSSAGEPGASRDTHGMSLNPARCRSCGAASWNAQACLGPISQSPRV